MCRGSEAEHITAFKTALGLADEDAAPVHLDVGRRILRLRYEAGSSASDVQQRRVRCLVTSARALVGAVLWAGPADRQGGVACC